MTRKLTVLQLGMAMGDSARSSLTRGMTLLEGALQVSSVPHRTPLHRPSAPLLAAALSGALKASDSIVALAAGPSEQSEMLGPDALCLDVLPELRELGAGTLVGSMHHASFLSLVAATQPELTVLVAAPLAEGLGHPDYGPPLADSWLRTVLHGSRTRDRQLHQMVGGVFSRGRSTAEILAIPDPDYRVFRRGEAVGPAFCCHYTLLHCLTRPGIRPHLNGSVLFVDVSYGRWIEVEELLRRILNIGFVGELAGLVLSTPHRVISVGERRDPLADLHTIFSRERTPSAIGFFGNFDVSFELGSTVALRLEC